MALAVYIAAAMKNAHLQAGTANILREWQKASLTCTPSWQLSGPAKTISDSKFATASEGGEVEYLEVHASTFEKAGHLSMRCQIGTSAEEEMNQPKNRSVLTAGEAHQLTFSERLSRYPWRGVLCPGVPRDFFTASNDTM